MVFLFLTAHGTSCMSELLALALCRRVVINPNEPVSLS